MGGVLIRLLTWECWPECIPNEHRWVFIEELWMVVHILFENEPNLSSGDATGEADWVSFLCKMLS